MIRSLYRLAILAAWLLVIASAVAAQTPASPDGFDGGRASRPSGRAETPGLHEQNDPVLRAMLAEMQRSKSQLKLADVQAPYYVDYRLTDLDQYMAEAAFGALRTALANPRPHAAHRGAGGRLQAGQLLRPGRGRG